MRLKKNTHTHTNTQKQQQITVTPKHCICIITSSIVLPITATILYCLRYSTACYTGIFIKVTRFRLRKKHCCEYQTMEVYLVLWGQVINLVDKHSSFTRWRPARLCVLSSFFSHPPTCAAQQVMKLVVPSKGWSAPIAS